MSMIILILLFMAGVTVILSMCTFWLVMSGNFKWNDGIRSTAGTVHTVGIGGSVALLVFLFGLGATLSAWPVLVVFVFIRLLIFGVMDALFGVGWFKRSKPERTITLKDGSKAVVDRERGKGFQRI